MKKIAFVTVIIATIAMASCKPQVLTPKQEAKIAEADSINIQKIEDANFTFYPTQVTPEFGTTIQLFGGGDSYLRVSGKNLDAELPYLGHFYIRPTSFSQDVPIKLYSSEFVYTVTSDKENDIYKVLIAPQDVYNIMNANMTIRFNLKKDGSGTLFIKTDNRDEISYDGYYR